MNEDQKRNAAEAAVEIIHDGSVIGMGSGSTVRYAILALGERVRAGLRVVCVPTSRETEALLGDEGIPTKPLSALNGDFRPEVYIDGADEIDPRLNLIKGKGGALLREKIVADASERFVVIADESKLVSRLGEKDPVPVEVLPEAVNHVSSRLLELFAEVVLREGYLTDNGNVICDCRMAHAPNDPAEFEREINNIPGVFENGLFIGRATMALVGTSEGVRTISK